MQTHPPFNSRMRLVLLGAIFVLTLGASVLPTRASASFYEISDGSVTGLYHLNDNGNDSSGNGRNGTFPNDSEGYAAGKLNNANLQTGTSYFSIPNATIPWGTNALSIAAWVKLASLGQQAITATVRTGAGLMFYQSVEGTFQFDKPYIVGMPYTWGGDYDWHFWVVESDSAGMRMYLDNVLVASNGNTANWVDPTDDVALEGYKGGGSMQGGWYMSGGRLDEVATFNTAISTSTIDALWNGGAGIEICTTVGCESAGTDTISLDYPVATTTPIEDFTHWVVSFTTATSTTATSSDFYAKQVYFGATSTYEGMDTLGGGTSELSSPQSIYKTWTFGGMTTYYAQAELRYFTDIYDEYGTLVATSSVVSFVVSHSIGASGWETPTSTTSSAAWVITCDPASGAFSYSMCYLAQALFVPSTAATSQFYGIGNLVKSKPPMGYFTQAKNVINSLSPTASSTFSFPDLSSLDTPLLTPVKTGFSLLLWFLFGFWLFHRMRHLQL